MTPRVAAALAALLACSAARSEGAAGAARRDATGDAPVAPPPGPSRPGAPRIGLLGLGAEVGGSPALYGLKGGLGLLRGGGEARMQGWLLWLELDGTGPFRPRRPADAGRTDGVLWVYPHLEVAQELAPRSLLFGWAHLGPTVGAYTANGHDVWFPGFCAGAGVQWALLRVGVRYYGQWWSATVPAPTGASGTVRVEPMVLVVAGLQLYLPAVPGSIGPRVQ